MAGDQRPRHQRGVERDEQRELAGQRQPQRSDAEAADARVLHDLEDARLVPAAAEAVDRVREPVLVEGAGRVDRRRHRQQHGHRLRPELECGHIDERADAADDQPHGREVAGRAVQRLGRVADPGRYRQAREEADRAEEVFELAADHALSETPADSKLAISFRKATAAHTSG